MPSKYVAVAALGGLILAAVVIGHVLSEPDRPGTPPGTEPAPGNGDGLASGPGELPGGPPGSPPGTMPGVSGQPPRPGGPMNGGKFAEAAVARLRIIEDPEGRARMLLMLLRSAGGQGGKLVRSLAFDADQPELRVPAVLALAGGGAEDVPLLLEIARDPENPELAAVAAVALFLAGTGTAQDALASLLEEADDAGRRQVLYDALAGATPEVTYSDAFVGQVRGEDAARGLVPDESLPGAYGRILAAVAAEDDPEALPAAARVLARMPEAAAQEGLLGLWSRAEGPVRERVFESVLADSPPGQGGLVVTLARSAKGPEAVELRRRALTRLAGDPDPRLVDSLREWAEQEEDPGLRTELEAEVLRLAGMDAREDR